MKTGHTIVKNFISLLTADAIVKTLGFAVTVYMARKLDPYDFGILSFSLSIVNYFSYFTDPGLTTYGVKKITREPEGVSGHMHDIFAIRAFLSVLSFAAIAAITAGMSQPPLVKTLILTYAVMLLPQALSPGWIYQGFQRMELMGLYGVVQALVYAGLMFAFMKGHQDVHLIPVFLVAAYAAAGAALLLPLIKKHGYSFRRVDVRGALAVIKESLPIGIATFLVAGVNWNLSTSMLGMFSQQAQAGYFSAAFRIVLVVIGAGQAFSIALYPAFSQHYFSSRETAEKILRLAEKALALAGIPLIAGAFATAVPLMTALFTDKYLGAAAVLKVVMGGGVLYCFNAVYGVYIVAADRQMAGMKIAIVRTIALASLSYALITGRGALGAALAYTASEFLTFLIYLAALERPAAGILGVTLKPLAAALGMYFAIFRLGGVNVFARVAAGAALYFIFLLLVGGVRGSELARLTDYMKNRPPRDLK